MNNAFAYRKKRPRKINHKNLWTIFSATHSVFCLLPLFVLYSCIIDFWYLAFASLHLTQMACDACDFFIDQKLIFKCIALGPFDKIKYGADNQKWNSSCLFKLTQFFARLHSHANFQRNNNSPLKYCRCIFFRCKQYAKRNEKCILLKQLRRVDVCVCK